MTVIRKRDPARHMARYYALNVQWAIALPGDSAQLCAPVHLVREWGRIGSPGTVRCDGFDSEAAALAGAESIARSKRRKGYG